MPSKRHLLDAANRALGRLPVRVETRESLASLRAKSARLDWQNEMVERAPAAETIPRAQLGQDLFALWASGFATGGYFVEFGAADGVMLSNTLLLERSFDWNGIVAEPARSWHEALRANRRCDIDVRCVWERSGETLTFLEPEDAFLSTIAEYVEADGHGRMREQASTYEVPTVSLDDLLEEHSAPREIDFMSIDTEGTEFEVLRAFSFDRYDVKVIAVEHAYNDDRRSRVHDLLTGRGFRRVLTEISQWDDWFVAPSVSLPPLA